MDEGFYVYLHLISGTRVSRKSSCSSYCIVHVADHDDDPVPGWNIVSHVAERSKNPIWDAEFFISIAEIEAKINARFHTKKGFRIEVYNKDKGRSAAEEPLGMVIIPWEDISEFKEERRTIPLTALGGGKSNTGTLRLQVTYRNGVEEEELREIASKQMRKASKSHTRRTIEISVKKESVQIKNRLTGRVVNIQSQRTKNGPSELVRMKESKGAIAGKTALVKVKALKVLEDEDDLKWVNESSKGLSIDKDTTLSDFKERMAQSLLRGVPTARADYVLSAARACSMYAVCEGTCRKLEHSELPWSVFEKNPESTSFIFSRFYPKEVISSIDDDDDVVLGYGILGAVPLLSCVYLLVITDVSDVGCLPIPGRNPEIFLVEHIEFIPVPPLTKAMDESLLQIDEKHRNKLEDLIDSSGLYFSYKYDISNACQRWFQATADVMSKHRSPRTGSSADSERSDFLGKVREVLAQGQCNCCLQSDAPDVSTCEECGQARCAPVPDYCGQCTMRRKCHTCGGRDKCPLRKESDILTTASFDEPLSHCECCKGQAKQMQPCAKCNTLCCKRCLLDDVCHICEGMKSCPVKSRRSASPNSLAADSSELRSARWTIVKSPGGSRVGSSKGASLSTLGTPPSPNPSWRKTHGPKKSSKSHIVHSSKSSRSKALQYSWGVVDDRFVWNLNIIRDFEANNLLDLCVPVVDGFISINNCKIDGNAFTYTLISRRGWKRAGARYITRGSDPLGNVANFVECEQIVTFGQQLSSFVQIRGSIPLMWSQPAGRKMKPAAKVTDFSLMQCTTTILEAHFEELNSIYGDQVISNLIDWSGTEQALGEEYEIQTKLLNSTKISYRPYDFHMRCANNNYDKPLGEYLQLVRPNMQRHGYYLREGDDTWETQCGTMRTNCIDCLDRTNVVCSKWAEHMLETVLKRMHIISQDHTINSHGSLSSVFKNVWADNADVISIRYTGAKALKTDFTRTGQRSIKGTAADAKHSTKRYQYQLGKDFIRQAGMDLFVQKQSVGCPSRDPGEDSSSTTMMRLDGMFGSQVLAGEHLLFPLVTVAAVQFKICIRDKELLTTLILAKEDLVIVKLEIYLLDSIEPHNFKQRIIQKPTWCDICGEFIWGTRKQSIVCKNCDCCIHEHCRSKAPACKAAVKGKRGEAAGAGASSATSAKFPISRTTTVAELVAFVIKKFHVNGEDVTVTDATPSDDGEDADACSKDQVWRVLEVNAQEAQRKQDVILRFVRYDPIRQKSSKEEEDSAVNAIQVVSLEDYSIVYIPFISLTRMDRLADNIFGIILCVEETSRLQSSLPEQKRLPACIYPVFVFLFRTAKRRESFLYSLALQMSTFLKSEKGNAVSSPAPADLIPDSKTPPCIVLAGPQLPTLQVGISQTKPLNSFQRRLTQVDASGSVELVSADNSEKIRMVNIYLDFRGDSKAPSLESTSRMLSSCLENIEVDSNGVVIAVHVHNCAFSSPVDSLTPTAYITYAVRHHFRISLEDGSRGCGHVLAASVRSLSKALLLFVHKTDWHKVSNMRPLFFSKSIPRNVQSVIMSTSTELDYSPLGQVFTKYKSKMEDISLRFMFEQSRFQIVLVSEIAEKQRFSLDYTDHLMVSSSSVTPPALPHLDWSMLSVPKKSTDSKEKSDRVSLLAFTLSPEDSPQLLSEARHCGHGAACLAVRVKSSPLLQNIHTGTLVLILGAMRLKNKSDLSGRCLLFSSPILEVPYRSGEFSKSDNGWLSVVHLKTVSNCIEYIRSQSVVISIQDSKTHVEEGVGMLRLAGGDFNQGSNLMFDVVMRLGNCPVHTINGAMRIMQG